MASRVVLHVGAMKSGTTYLQYRLLGNTDVLAEQGVLFPRVGNKGHTAAVQDALGRLPDGVAPEARAGLWAGLCQSAAEWPGTVVVSAEVLAAANVANIRRVVESFAPAEVEVVLTARDLTRNIPAMWQESLQNGRTWSSSRCHLVAVTRRSSGSGSAVWSGSTRTPAPPVSRATPPSAPRQRRSCAD
jgi:hypothetical protein